MPQFRCGQGWGGGRGEGERGRKPGVLEDPKSSAQQLHCRGRGRGLEFTPGHRPGRGLGSKGRGVVPISPVDVRAGVG